MTNPDMVPEEEIQLTELRTVEQSLIKPSDCGEGMSDCHDTDGLRVLRSYATANGMGHHRNNNNNHHNRRRRKLDELEQFGSGYPRRRRSERWKHLAPAGDDFGIGCSEDDDDDDDDDEELPDPSDRTNKLRVKNGTKYTIDNSLHSDEFEDVDAMDDDDDDDHRADEEDPDFYGEEGDYDYLGGKYSNQGYSAYGNDEDNQRGVSPVVEVVAAKKQKQQQPKQQQIQQQQQQRQPSGVKSWKSTQVQPPKPRRRGRPRKNSFTEKDSNDTSVQEQPQPSPEQSEKELQTRVNEIIKENLLMEQENNNLAENVNRNESKVGRICRVQRKGIAPEAAAAAAETSSPKRYNCQICDASFKGAGGLRNHTKVTHENGPYYKCDECGKEFPLKERLKLHVRTHTGFRPYQCKECDKSFARSGQLVQHRRTHSTVKPYSCDLCYGTFTCAANLSLHIKRHYGQKDHKCDVCGRAFVRRDALKKHQECLHKDVKSFLCTICNKTFKGHLPQHMRTHAQDRPHGCATCGQRFAQKSQLTVHQRTHSGQRPFRCLVCWQAFAHSTALKLHTRRHTGERPFKCAECNAGFTQLPHWKKHMARIHGRVDPYCCRNCNSFFRIKNDLEAHEKDCLAEPDEPEESADGCSPSALARFRNMTIEKIRLLLAVLLKRISKPDRLEELGFGKRLIDEVLIDSLVLAGKDPVRVGDEAPEFEALKKNLAIFLEWTVPKEHWDTFRKMKKTPEEILETLTAT